MKTCTGYYKYKGFLINFSEYYQEWRLEPTFLGDSDEATDFAIEYNNDSRGFKTINQAKKYIRENEEELVKEVMNEYKKYCK